MPAIVFTAFPRLKFVWFFLLPWLGYIATLRTAKNSDTILLTVLIGWVMLFVYQVLKLGLVQLELETLQQQHGWRTVLRTLPSLLPVTAIGVNQHLLGGNWKSFFLEQFALEVLVLVTAVVVIIFTARDPSGRTSWEELGIVPLFFGALILGGVWGIVRTWWELQDYAHASTETLLCLTLALGSEFFQDYRVLRKIVGMELSIQDLGNETWAMVAVLGQLFLWLALPAVRLL